jgi:hypothetical protein
LLNAVDGKILDATLFGNFLFPGLHESATAPHGGGGATAHHGGGDAPTGTLTGGASARLEIEGINTSPKRQYKSVSQLSEENSSNGRISTGRISTGKGKKKHKLVSECGSELTLGLTRRQSAGQSAEFCVPCCCSCALLVNCRRLTRRATCFLSWSSEAAGCLNAAGLGLGRGKDDGLAQESRCAGAPRRKDKPTRARSAPDHPLCPRCAPAAAFLDFSGSALKTKPAPPGMPFGVHIDLITSMANLEVHFCPPGTPGPPVHPRGDFARR